MTTAHYAEFLHPGTFVSENSTQRVESRDVAPTMPAGAYGYRFYSQTEATAPDGELMKGRPRDHSAWHYFGTPYTLEQVMQLAGDHHILTMNMRNNGWGRVLRCAQGFIPLMSGDVVMGVRP